MIAAVLARSGWEIAMACEPPSIWTVVEPIRSAAARSESG